MRATTSSIIAGRYTTIVRIDAEHNDVDVSWTRARLQSLHPQKLQRNLC